MKHLLLGSVLAVLISSFALSWAQPADAASLPYSESFTTPDGGSWPAPWFNAGAHVTTWDVQSGRARLNGDPGFVARMVLPGYAAVDVEALFTLEFENVAVQGIGFYVRQNGGTLQEYLPHGQGYAVFLKGGWGWPEDLGVWREINGVETQFYTGYNPIAGGLQNNTRYRVRMRVTQVHPDTTLIQSRVWPEAQSEPAAWTVEVRDTEPLLQGTGGSFAVDIYNYSGTSHIFMDDILLLPYSGQSAIPDGGGLAGLRLAPPHPNPARGAARLQFSLPEGVPGTLTVHDIQGRLLAAPFTGVGSGDRTVSWSPLDEHGRRLPAGTYFVRLQAEGTTAVQRLVLVD